MEGIHYLGIAYMFIWFILGIFGFSLMRKQKRINDEINDLKEKLNYNENS